MAEGDDTERKRAIACEEKMNTFIARKYGHESALLDFRLLEYPNEGI